MVSTAFGRPLPPKKANKFQATMVTGVQACTAANTTLPGALMTPGCDPVVANDTVCQFAEKNGKLKGKGKVLAKAKDDIKLKAKLVNLTDSCNGETLCAVATVTTTSDNCASGGSCTGVTSIDLPLGIACCLVEKNKCKIKTTVNTALPGALVPGNYTEFIIGEVGLKRTGASAPAFKGGLLLE
jgi:hypothetical protein